MANWLEEEELKKSLLLQREEAAHKQPRNFYSLCERVNGVKPNSLSIHRLKVEGQRTFTIRDTEVDGDGGWSGEQGKRGIQLSCPSQYEIFVDVIINEHHSSFDRVCGDISTDRKRVVVRRKCNLQALSDWREDQLLNVIQWMMLESDAIEGNVPGIEVMTDEAVAESAARRREAEATAAMALAALQEKIAQQRAAIASGWSQFGGAVAILAGLFLATLVCQYFANHHDAPSLLRILLGVVGALGVIVFGLAAWVGVPVVLVMLVVQLFKANAGRAKIATLESESKSHPANR
jgi:hypothetical protein